MNDVWDISSWVLALRGCMNPISQADWIQQWICAYALGKTCTHLFHKGKTAFVWENCSGVIKYKLPDAGKFFFFFSPELKCWLKYVTDKYMHWCMVSAAVWLPPLKLKKKTPSTQPQTSHIRDGCSACTHHLHMYCSPDISRCVHAGVCQAGWKPQKQWLCLAKVDITDLLNSFSNCCRFFDCCVFLINLLTFMFNVQASL